MLAVRIHRVGKPDEAFEPVGLEMLLASHRPNHLCEEAEIGIFYPERVVLEERKDASLDIEERVDCIRQHAASGALGADPSATENGCERFEHSSMPLMLVDVEDRVQLPTPSRTRVLRIPVDGDGETSLAVDESDDPARIELEPRLDGFLLIVRTGRIVTTHGPTLRGGCDSE